MESSVGGTAGSRIVPLILAGGSGTRLWPLSRDSLPKQFVPLMGELSSFQETIRRVSDRRLFDDPVVVTRADFRFYAEQQARAVGGNATILLEPEGRDSAAAIASGTAFIARDRPGAVALSLAADHVIPDAELFVETCIAARELAAAGRIVTFGIRPSEPRTSYGYVRPGAAIGPNAFEVAAFTEKPDAAAAAELVAQGCLWNSGNFMFAVETMRRELEFHAPDVIGPATEAVEAATADLGFIRLGEAAYARARRTSIDYAVMEKTATAAVVEAGFRWSDVGSWDAVWALSRHDDKGNARVGAVEMLDAQGTLAYSDGPLLAVCGVKDVLVGGDERRRPHRRARPQRGGQGARRQSRQGQPAGGERASPRAAALGLFRVRRRGRALPGQADRRLAREPSSPCRSICTGPSIGSS